MVESLTTTKELHEKHLVQWIGLPELKRKKCGAGFI